MTQAIRYRPEIDGLRAIAVTSVIFYHAEFVVGGRTLFEGGYIGVDIFFVISGYLISKIIFLEYETQQGFSFARFYERRARRILPALLLVMVMSLPAAWLILMPDQFIRFVQSIVASIFFASNVFFHFTTTEYGAQTSLQVPFLHTWSLSVEEQFYLVFPLLAIGVAKYARPYAMTIFLGIAFISLAFADVAATRNSSLNFYLPFSRAWELLAGVLIAQWELKRSRGYAPVVQKTMPTIGLALVIASIALFTKQTAHPSVITLAPIIGVVLIIVFSNGQDLAGRLLSSRPFVSIGLISYSLYLWHFPIFAFWRIDQTGLDNIVRLSIIGATIILSITSYIAVERPFRNTAFLPTRKAISILMGSILALVVFSGGVWWTDGALFRLTDTQKNAHIHFKEDEWERLKGPGGNTGYSPHFDENRRKCDRRDPSEACAFGNRRFVTLGDSYIGHYDFALREMAEEMGEGLLVFSYAQCPFLLDDYWFGNHAECPLINQGRWREIESFDEPKVFLVSVNDLQFTQGKKKTPAPLKDGQREITEGDPIEADVIWQSYGDAIARLLDLGHRVVLIRSLPTTRINAKQQFFKALKSEAQPDGRVQRRFSTADAERLKQRDDLKYPKIDHENLIVFDPVDTLCKQRGDRRRCMVIDRDGALYGKDMHLSYLGARQILEDILKEVSSRGWLNSPDP